MRTKQVARHARDWVPYSFYRRSVLAGEEDDDKKKKKKKKKATATTGTSPIRTRGFEKKEELQKQLEKMNVASTTSSSREEGEVVKQWRKEMQYVLLIREPEDRGALARSAPLLPMGDPLPLRSDDPSQQRVTEFTDEMLRDFETGRAQFLHHNSVPYTSDSSPEREVVPPKMLERYNQQVEESGGYDVGFFPKLEYTCHIHPVFQSCLKDYEYLAHIAIEEANNEKQDGPLKFEKLVKMNMQSGGYFTLYLTLEVIDSADGKRKTCQTKLTQKPGHHPVVLEFRLMHGVISKRNRKG